MRDTELLFRASEAGAILTGPDLIELGRSGSIHFMGIGGAGMAPLAELLLRHGARVSGCDAHPGPATRALEALGATIYPGHDPAHVEACAALVMTAAIAPTHPEIEAARRRGIPVLKRAAALGAIVNRGTVVGIAGTHGKTTTTAMTTATFVAAGLDPTALVGGHVHAWDGNLRPGGDRLFVVEADEYDRSFLTLRPTVAVVTTLEADHLDIYGTLAGVEDAFLAFTERVVEGGTVIGCADESGVGRLLARVDAGRHLVVSYGLSAGSMLRGEDVRVAGAETHFAVRERGRTLGRARLHVPGLHNVRNALGAIAAARALGAEWDALREGLESYRGVERRFERIGEAAGVQVVDDYAHHPTEIAATLAAARLAHADRRVVAVFQPHLYSRTRDFAEEFGRALAAADLVLVTDVYAAREAPIAGVSGRLIADAAVRAGAVVHYVAERGEVTERVTELLEAGDLCLTLGAGDLNVAAREIVARLAARAAAA